MRLVAANALAVLLVAPAWGAPPTTVGGWSVNRVTDEMTDEATCILTSGAVVPRRGPTDAFILLTAIDKPGATVVIAGGAASLKGDIGTDGLRIDDGPFVPLLGVQRGSAVFVSDPPGAMILAMKRGNIAKVRLTYWDQPGALIYEVPLEGFTRAYAEYRKCLDSSPSP